MNKLSARSFSLGIIFTVAVTWAGTQLLAQEKSPSLSISAAKDVLDSQGFVVLSEAEYEELKTPAKVEEQQNTENKTVESKKEAADANSESEEEKKEEKVYKLKIISGMSPVEIAEILESEGIVKNAGKFERFLIDKDYHTEVQLGTFELKSGLDYKQVADIITKN